MAITTALTLRAVFRQALRQTEGLIGSILALLGLDLAVADHTTISRRAETLAVPRPRRERAPVHLLLDSTGLRLCGPGEWLGERHGTRGRRSWRKLHPGTDADTGHIVASVLTGHDTDDGSQVGPLLAQVDGAVASFTGDGAFDRDDVCAANKVATEPSHALTAFDAGSACFKIAQAKSTTCQCRAGSSEQLTERRNSRRRTHLRRQGVNPAHCAALIIEALSSPTEAKAQRAPKRRPSSAMRAIAAGITASRR